MVLGTWYLVLGTWYLVPETRYRECVAVLAHEGTYSILYGSWPLPIGSGHRTGYLARPDEAGRFPVVMVLPGIDGLTGLEKDLCRRLARRGLVGISFGFHRAGDDPVAAYTSLSDDEAMSALNEVHEFVSSPDVEWVISGEVGMLGLDVGGRFALIAAATQPWVRSLVVCSTPLTGDEDRRYQVAGFLDHLPIPVLGLYGMADDLIDPTSVDEAQRRNDHGQWLLYEDAGHGFLDLDSPDYQAAAADDAMARTVAFFQGTLPEPVVEELG